MGVVKKYEFNTEATAKKYISELFVENENGEQERKKYKTKGAEKEYIAHVVEIGFLPKVEAVIDANGDVLVEAEYSDKYSVDVLWESKVEKRWNRYEIEVEGDGVHKFI